jgi:choline-sulfatase
MLGEHGLWLKNCLLDGAARVPVIMSGPGVPRGKSIDNPISHVDMVATMLDLGGAGVAKELRGRSLLAEMRGESGPHPQFAYSESHSEGNCTGSFMIRKGDWKYLYFTGGNPLLFNMKSPGGEFQDLAGDGQHQPVLKELHELLCSRVDPDKVTFDAFDKQAQVLAGLVKRKSRAEFYETLQGRLGPIQARIITDRHYGRA